MPSPRFIHLTLHTEYSLVDGLISVKSLLRQLTEHGMPAVALTDHCNLFALVKFYKAALSTGIKPIIGADIQLANSPSSRLVLLCQNETGYRNLTRLISRMYLEGQKTGVPLLQKEWLWAENEGLIALSGGQTGDIGQAILEHHLSTAEALAKEWAQHFPDRFYIQLHRIGREHEETYLQHALKLAQTCDLPVVATNDVCFLSPDDFEAHETRVCIREGFTLNDPRRPHRYTPQQYLRSEEEMLALFSDIPSSLENTVEIAKRCNVPLNFDKTFLPNFPVPEGTTIEEFFRAESESGLKKRFESAALKETTGLPRAKTALAMTAEEKHDNTPRPLPTQIKQEEYEDRLRLEMNTIIQMGFEGYFLIVADFIRWAKEQGIPVGPGRGSGAGSLVAYALEITDLDPLQQDLLFERFLNPERVSMADFDIDFCTDGRDRVIEYVSQKYGRQSVSQIITYGTMAAKAVIRDVGRALGYPYGFVDKIAKLIPFELGMTLEKALHDEPQLQERYEQEDDVKTLIDLAKKLEGVPRNAGKHAGGVVIAPSVLTDFTPLYCEPGDENSPVTQFDKHDVEHVGLVKFDFLGLRTLTIIDWALRAINERLEQNKQPAIEINKIPLDDPAAYKLLQACETAAVFQLESRGMRELIHRLQPNRFDDIVALVALYRPGPLQSGMVDDFIARKHGQAPVIYLHPLLEPILCSTYGVILYQEQVMQIAQVLAGYTLGGADILRRAMGKKKPEEMAKQRAIFVAGAEERDIPSELANQIFNLMEMFADYGFNKSHSAAYALLSYQTAWLKAHYPAEFMAAVLSADMEKTDKVVRYLEDTRRCGLTVLPPNVHQSEYKFTVSTNAVISAATPAVIANATSLRAAVLQHGNPATLNLIGNPEDSTALEDGYTTLTRPTGTLSQREKGGASGEKENTPPTVIYGLGAIKGLGEAVIEAIIKERKKGGNFTSLFDFCKRLSGCKLNKKSLEALIQSGALDCFGEDRSVLMASLETALKNADQIQRLKKSGQMDLFQTNLLEPLSTQPKYIQAAPWNDETRLLGEKAVLGWYVSGHPITQYQAELAHFVTPISQLTPTQTSQTSNDPKGKKYYKSAKKIVTTAGYITHLRVVYTKSGDRIAFLTLDDCTGRLEVGVFSELFPNCRHLLVKDQLIIVSGEVSVDDYTEQLKLSAEEVWDLTEAREKYAKCVRLNMTSEQLTPDFLAQLQETFTPFLGGSCLVKIDYSQSQATACLELGNAWKIKPSEALIHTLRQWVGVEVEYD